MFAGIAGGGAAGVKNGGALAWFQAAEVEFLEGDGWHEGDLGPMRDFIWGQRGGASQAVVGGVGPLQTEKSDGEAVELLGSESVGGDRLVLDKFQNSAAASLEMIKIQHAVFGVRWLVFRDSRWKPTGSLNRVQVWNRATNPQVDDKNLQLGSDEESLDVLGCQNVGESCSTKQKILSRTRQPEVQCSNCLQKSHGTFGGVSMSNFWIRKLAAYLHDPPSKCLDILTHSERSAESFRQAGFLDDNRGILVLYREFREGVNL